MAQLPESHERDYLELLKPYVSEEHKKSRRNVVVTSFVILSIYLLGISLTEIRIFGIDLNGSNKFTVLALALLLIIYWLAIYLAYARRDLEIQKEQERLLLSSVEKVKERMDQAQVKMDEHKNSRGGASSHWSSEFGSAKSNYIIYENQINRTKKAGKLNSLLAKVEYWLPVVLAVVSIIVLVVDARSFL